MNAPLIVVPFAIELTVLITTIAPLALTGRFGGKPNLGIALWLGSFLVAFLSVVTALAISVWSVFDTWHALQSHTQPLWHTILFSFAPWIILGFAGITMALIAQKLDPIREARKSDVLFGQLPSTRLLNFHGLEVRMIELPIWIAFTRGIGRNAKIYVSRLAHENLKSEEFEALLWHERGHALQWHNAIKGVVGIIRLLGGLMLASRVLNSEINRLCESAADIAALRHTSQMVLNAARAKFPSETVARQ